MPVVILVLAAIGALVLFVFDPSNSAFYPSCMFHEISGLYCPGCGSLRATHKLLHGDLAAAFRLNPLFVLSLPILGALVLRPSWAYRVWVPWTALGVLILYGILRNIPAWPFYLLAPH